MPHLNRKNGIIKAEARRIIMTRRKLALALMTAMALSLTACNNASDNNTATQAPTTTQAPATQAPVQDTQAEANGDLTMGQALLADFNERIAANPDMAPIDMVAELINNPVIQFMPGTMEVEEGFLNGFSAEVKGFEKGAIFNPMIGSIPFVGYVFTVPDGTAEDFKKTLSDLADPRWNICTQADETIIESAGNTVFFLMCPTSMEE